MAGSLTTRPTCHFWSSYSNHPELLEANHMRATAYVNQFIQCTVDRLRRIRERLPSDPPALCQGSTYRATHLLFARELFARSRAEIIP